MTNVIRVDPRDTARMSDPHALPPLLAADEPAAFSIERPGARGPWVLLCDHASPAIPRALGGLGLGDADRGRHIAWDIGAAALTRQLAAALDATAVLQNWSRLVIDCNRPPGAADSIAAISDGTRVPGNRVDEAERARRRAAIFDPYHNAIRQLLDARREAGRPTRLLMMHSFTPVYAGCARPWQVGVLYGRDARLATIVLDALRREPGLCVGENLPYDVSDETDYAVPVHGEARGLPHVELELRQDLIAQPHGQRHWARRLATLLAADEARIAPLDLPRGG